MSVRFDVHRRLESSHPHEDLERGFRAEVHDPAWFLGRQWQLGEHQGEDASSPVRVSYRASSDDIDPYLGEARWDPSVVPPEVVVESEAGDWWTVGRRIRLGIEASQALKAPNALDPNGLADELLLACLFDMLPPPIGDRLRSSAYDGQQLWQHRIELGIQADPAFDQVPADPDDFWDPSRLAYTASFTCRGAALTVDEHDGGHLDWYSVDADRPVTTGLPQPDAVETYPTRFHYAGAPHPRWWQIEDAAVDIGGFPPDRSHFPTMLLVDLLLAHSDDWFTFQVDTRSGVVLSMREVVVTDSFDETFPVSAPPDWSIFKVKGLAPNSLVVWPSISTTLAGTSLEEVVVGMDEDANLLWGVETRLFGRDVGGKPKELPQNPPEPGLVDAGKKSYRYRPSSDMAEHWHPYDLEVVDSRRVFRQARLANLQTVPPTLMPPAKASLLTLPEPAIHEIIAAAVPVNGMRIEKRWKLARGTDGSPQLWLQRQRFPLLGPPTSGLRFDQLQGQAPPVA